MEPMKVSGLCGVDVLCELTTMVVDGEEGIRYTTYGMELLQLDDQKIASVDDISTSRNLVEDFICLLINHNVALIHVMDVLEDYLD